MYTCVKTYPQSFKMTVIHRHLKFHIFAFSIDEFSTVNTYSYIFIPIFVLFSTESLITGIVMIASQ